MAPGFLWATNWKILGTLLIDWMSSLCLYNLIGTSRICWEWDIGNYILVIFKFIVTKTLSFLRSDIYLTNLRQKAASVISGTPGMVQSCDIVKDVFLVALSSFRSGSGRGDTGSFQPAQTVIAGKKFVFNLNLWLSSSKDIRSV